MSGLVQDNIFDLSGVIAASSDSLSWQSVVTASSLTAVAGNGYPINTTSNTCTITLPGSASAGDQIIFVDYARNWGTNKIIIDSNGLNFQGNTSPNPVYSTDGQSVKIVYIGATKGWIPTIDDDVTLETPQSTTTAYLCIENPDLSILFLLATYIPYSIFCYINKSGIETTQ